MSLREGEVDFIEVFFNILEHSFANRVDGHLQGFVNLGALELVLLYKLLTAI